MLEENKGLFFSQIKDCLAHMNTSNPGLCTLSICEANIWRASGPCCILVPAKSVFYVSSEDKCFTCLSFQLVIDKCELYMNGGFRCCFWGLCSVLSTQCRYYIVKNIMFTTLLAERNLAVCNQILTCIFTQPIEFMRTWSGGNQQRVIRSDIC